MRRKAVLLQLTLMNKLFSRLKSSGKFPAYIPNILLMATHTLLTKMSRLIPLTQCKLTSPVIRVDLFPRLLNLNLSQAANFSGGQSILRIFVTHLSVMASSHSNNFYLVCHSRWKNTKRRRKINAFTGPSIAFHQIVTTQWS